MDGRESLTDAMIVSRSADVAVIYDFVVNEGECTAEGVEVNLS